MKLLRCDEANRYEFEEIISSLVTNETVLRMKEFRQHCNTDCFKHCYEASFYCYLICKYLGLDYVSATRGAMLHDLFLYDWRVGSDINQWHAFRHGLVAYNNAKEIFDLNEIEKDMIVNHMWPLTIKLPKTKEGMILTLVDKYCATKEIIDFFKLKLLGIIGELKRIFI